MGWRFYHRDPPYRHPTGPLLVEFIAGPGTGKSTTAAAVFAALKQKGRNVEYVPEYAKDLTWEGRTVALSCQPYVIAKQMRNFDRLNGQVEAIITDTSTLLGLYYGDEAHGATPAFRAWIKDDHERRRTMTVFLRRNPKRAYNPAGRSQTEEEAKKIDTALYRLLDDNKIHHYTVHVDPEHLHVPEIVRNIETRLRFAG